MYKELIDLLKLDIYYYKLKETIKFKSNEKDYIENEIYSYKNELRQINKSKYKFYLIGMISDINKFGTISDIQRDIEKRIRKIKLN